MVFQDAIISSSLNSLSSEPAVLVDIVPLSQVQLFLGVATHLTRTKSLMR